LHVPVQSWSEIPFKWAAARPGCAEMVEKTTMEGAEIVLMQ
jgi:hypothetical protein